MLIRFQSKRVARGRKKHRLFPQSHFVDGIEPRAPEGASALRLSAKRRDYDR